MKRKDKAELSGLEDLNLLRALVHSIEMTSLTAASRYLGVTPATVSKQIASLEKKAGCLLINRTTRQLAATEAGQLLYAKAKHILDELESVEAELSDMQNIPTGLLRVTAPAVFAAHLIGPELPKFMKLHPRLSIQLVLALEKIDLVHERIDIAIRITSSPDPSSIALPLSANRRAFVASPEYLERYGTPKTAYDLQSHNCLIGGRDGSTDVWPIQVGRNIERVKVRGNLMAPNGDILLSAAIGGLGISMLPWWLARKHIESGELIEVMQNMAISTMKIYAVLPHWRYVPTKVKCFVDYFRAHLDSIGD